MRLLQWTHFSLPPSLTSALCWILKMTYAWNKQFQAGRKSSNFDVFNYSLKWRWPVVDIYWAVKQWGKYPPLAADTEMNSCFGMY